MVLWAKLSSHHYALFHQSIIPFHTSLWLIHMPFEFLAEVANGCANRPGRGVAERAEIYLGGIELANGYREEFRPQLVRERWIRYNEIRVLRREPVHTLDEAVLAALPSMQGVAGMALGLERMIVATTPGLTLQSFA